MSSSARHVLGAGLALAIAGGAARADGLTGAWCGIGEQRNPNGEKSYWSIHLNLAGAEGQIEYPSLDCGGTLALERSEASTHTYRERITWGRERCLDNGLLAVQPVGTTLRWTWTGLDGGVEITAVATLTTNCESKPGSSAALGAPRLAQRAARPR